METAETLAQIIAGEDLELTGFSVRMRDRLVARIKARDNATRLAGKREAFAQVARELTSWAAQHVDAGFPEMKKTILEAAKTYADKARLLAQPVEPGQEKR